MSQIDAIYRNGVFEPLQPVELQEDQRVRLQIELTEKEAWAKWVDEVRKHHDEILKRRGGECLPDSTPGIAEDRLR
jgi:predicted DNA-binding antitoxin AbrB/MazE fold protein